MAKGTKSSERGERGVVLAFDGVSGFPVTGHTTSWIGKQNAYCHPLSGPWESNQASCPGQPALEGANGSEVSAVVCLVHSPIDSSLALMLTAVSLVKKVTTTFFHQ